jgi:hypothetical protein
MDKRPSIAHPRTFPRRRAGPASSWSSSNPRPLQKITLRIDEIRFDIRATARSECDVDDADPGLGGAHAFGYAIAADPNNERRLFASTLGSTIAVTTDAGATWQPSDDVT